MSARTFASDNYSGVHPDVMRALFQANVGHVASYGADEFTARAIDKFKTFFGNSIEVYFVYNGTGSNVLALSALTQSYHSIICSDLAHINVDESTAPEKFTGCKLLTIPTKDGKIYPLEVETKIQRLTDQHHPQVKVISISQSTEYGTVYSVEEVKALSSVAKKHNLFLHMDGARLCNAAAYLKEDFRTFTIDCGVDVLSFGGTKNGMMFGEAIIFFKPELARDFPYIRKQGMQLHSKGRFIGAQFEALLSNNLWRENAFHANQMAKLLEKGLRKNPKVKITQSVQANGIFVMLPTAIIPILQQEHFFYVWNERTSEVRLMCSFDTTEKDVDNFVERLNALLTDEIKQD